MAEVMAHVAQAKSITHQARNHRPAQELAVNQHWHVPLSRDYQHVRWPAAAAEALRQHSESPVLTFRLPLPEDFIAWLEAGIAQMGHSSRKPATAYLLQRPESLLTAKLLPKAGALNACVIIDVAPCGRTAANLSAKDLTPRECEVAYWVAQGKRNDEIGIILGCKSSTVRKHVQSILGKLNAETRNAIIAEVLRGLDA